MKINIDYKEGISSIDHMIADMQKIVKSDERAVLNSIGKIISINVKKHLYHSNIEERSKKIPSSNYDKSKPYLHMKEDVISSVRKDKSGNAYVSVHGGKMTGFKWHYINDGHFARDGITYVQGNHFMDKAIAESEAEVNKIMDDMIGKVAGK